MRMMMTMTTMGRSMAATPQLRSRSIPLRVAILPWLRQLQGRGRGHDLLRGVWISPVQPRALVCEVGQTQSQSVGQLRPARAATRPPPFLWSTTVDADHPWTSLSSKMPGARWWADGVLNTLARWHRPISYPCTPFYLDILCAGTAGEVYGLEVLFVTICFVLFLSSNHNLQTERL